ncbi:intermembrane space import and assembly protein 40 [Coprinopsis sp. MPI-PUGE-AT-0042]|nr:intermembrane space import and assembly protein 40 [Coprinopsis sp. MPI-PUGE-AT-0042]
MFSRITRLPLRRCLHTASSGAQSAASSRTVMARVGRVALGASLVATALVSYNLSSERSRIHLDSPSTSTKLSALKPSSAAPTSSSTTPSSTSSSTPAPSSSEPKPTSSEEEESSPKPEGEDGDKSSGAGASGQQGAYNPETGEINWDCPCLGGMAHGPCGEQFKEAFSCFVFSEEEPKGINCVDAFKKMQDCFREHPEVYADEIMDDDEDEDPSRPAPESPEGQALEKVEGAVAEALPFIPDVSEETETPKAAVKKAKSSSKPSSPSP